MYITGGEDTDDVETDEVDCVDVSRGTTTSGTRMTEARSGHTSVATADGLCVFGGWNNGRDLSSCELLKPEGYVMIYTCCHY